MSDNSNDIQRCPAGGPDASPERVSGTSTPAPWATGRLLHLPAPRVGERALHRRPGQLMPAASLTDQLGRPIAVGTRVVPIAALGTVLWSRGGRVTGLGRTLVHVRWNRERYDRARRYHAVRGERLRIPRGMMSSATAPADK